MPLLWWRAYDKNVKTLYGGQFRLSSQLIKPSSLAIPTTDTASKCLWKHTPPTQYHSFLANKKWCISDGLKRSAFSCNMNAKLLHECKVVTQMQSTNSLNARCQNLSVLTFCDFFMYIIGKKKIGFPLQFRVITFIFKDYTLHSPVILLSLNNSLVLINTKLHSKSCYYLHKCTLFTPHY